MIPKILLVNSGLLVLSTAFLIYAIGRSLITWNGTMLGLAVAAFLVLLVSELIFSLYT